MTQIMQVTDDFCTVGQLHPDHMAQIAEFGFKTVINNRPDGEGGVDQPTSAVMAEAAREAGLAYFYLPVVSGAITPEQAVAMRELLEKVEKPVLAFCRSGARSTHLFQLSQA